MPPPSPPQPPKAPCVNFCHDTCVTASDGTCDDGGEKSASAVTCAIGTDCTDCGSRCVEEDEPAATLRSALLSLSPNAATPTTIKLAEGQRIVLGGAPLGIPKSTTVIIRAERAPTHGRALGESGGVTNDGAGRSGIFEVYGHLRLEGVHLTGGRADQLRKPTTGGAMIIHSAATATLISSMITDCSATATGSGNAYAGAMLIDPDASATLINTTIARCSAINQGSGDAWSGAIEVSERSNLTIDGGAIVDCSATTMGSRNAYSGAVTIRRDASATLTQTTISRCSATAQGSGAAWSGAFGLDQRASLTVNGGTIADCMATTMGSQGAYGGMIRADEGSRVVFSSITVARCSSVAQSSGTAYGNILASGSLMVQNSVIIDCWVTAMASQSNVYGGAMFIKARAALINTTIVNCSASALNGGSAHSGALEVDSGASITMDGCTITDCSVTATGTAVAGAMRFGTEASATLINTTIARCSATSQGSGDAWSGAVEIRRASASLNGCSIIDCSATAMGQGTALGGAFVIYENSNVTLTDTTVAGCSAATQAANKEAGGGAFEVGGAKISVDETMVALNGGSIVDCSVITMGRETASGGAMRINIGSSATFIGTTVARCSATAQGSGFAQGGAFSVMDRGGLAMYDSALSDSFAKALGSGRAQGGVIRVAFKARVTLRRSSLTNGTVVTHGDEHASGGGIAMLQDSKVTLEGSIIASCSAIALQTTTKSDGGGLFNQGGTLLLRNGSGLRGNVASSSGACMVQEGEATCVLPAPRGTWAAARKCEVYRRACPYDPATGQLVDASCPLTADACTREVNSSAAVNGTACQPVLFNQPCDWTNTPELIGEIVEVLPQARIDVDYPYICSAGLLRSSNPNQQTSSLCGGLCPAGYVCPAGQDPSICPTGRYCPLGTSVPLPCPSGTYSSLTGLSAASQCEPCPLGFWCSAGKAIACPMDTYNDALSADDQGDCTQCPSQAITLQTSAKRLADCKCDADYYNADDASGGVRCERCPLGALCEGSGATLSALRLRRGFYRSTNRSIDVRRCPDAAANCTSTKCDGGLMSGCLGEPTQPCVDGLTGHYCSMCSASSRPRALPPNTPPFCSLLTDPSSSRFLSRSALRQPYRQLLRRSDYH